MLLCAPVWAAEPALVQGDKIAITVLDMQADALRMPPEMRTIVLAKPQTVTQIASNLYARRAMADKAEADGLANDPETAAALKIARDKVLSDALLAKIDKNATPSDAAAEGLARNIYKAKPERFKTPEQVQVRHILLPLAPDGSDDAAVKARAEELLAQARKGADFAKLAAQYSSDKASAQRGGDLGFFGRGKMLPEFENAAFGLKKPGDLAGPVKTRFGYHIIELVALKPASAAKFEDVAPELEQEAKAKIEGQARERLWDAAGAGAKVNEAALKAMAEQASR